MPQEPSNTLHIYYIYIVTFCTERIVCVPQGNQTIVVTGSEPMAEYGYPPPPITKCYYTFKLYKSCSLNVRRVAGEINSVFHSISCMENF